MKTGGRKPSKANAATTRALRSVLIATGGQAKVAELYRLLTAADAADFLGVSLSYVQHATGRGELPCVRIGKGDPRYRTIDLIEWQEARRTPAVP
jgi:excisionase family DNA binding protein